MKLGKMFGISYNFLRGRKLKFSFKFCKGRLQLKILVVFTTKTGGEGSGQLLTNL